MSLFVEEKSYAGSAIENWFFPEPLLFKKLSYHQLWTSVISHHTSSSLIPLPLSLSSSSTVYPPMITEQPRDMLSVTPGTNATFTVVASGLRLTYTWMEGDGKPLSNRRYVIVNGTLTIPIVSRVDAGNFSCLVSNPAGNVTSQSAELTLSKLCTYVCC